MRTRACLLLAAVCTSTAPLAEAAINVTGPTTEWITVDYTSLNQHDFFDDEQTGIPEADLVGDNQHPVLYTQFDDAGTPSLTDGTIAYRVRVGSHRPPANPPPLFDANTFIGIDADLDGGIDLYVGVNNRGAGDALAIWDPGTNSNTSPNTTSIISPPAQTFTETATNYNFSFVSSTNDPPATNFDIDADGANDVFLSFSFAFSDVVAQMQTIAGLAIDETTVVRYILATSNQDNALNQDLNGTDGITSSDLTWSALGAISDEIAINGVVIPEPGSLALTGLAGLGLALFAGRHRFSRQKG